MIGLIAFIGLGRQGAPIAAKLAEAGRPIAVWDRSAEALSAFEGPNARIARSARDAAAGAQWLITCLPDQADVAETLFGAGAVAAALARGATVIDHSSLSSEAAAANAAGLRAAGQDLALLDAPLSGGPRAAAEGSLVVWIGGDEQRFRAALPLLSTYARDSHFMGPSGSGQIAKSCHQLVACGTVALWEEALNLARASGLDPSKTVRAMAGAAADSLVGRTFAPDLALGRFPPNSFANFTKDLENVAALATRLGIDAPLAEAALDRFAKQIAPLVQSGGLPRGAK